MTKKAIIRGLELKLMKSWMQAVDDAQVNLIQSIELNKYFNSPPGGSATLFVIQQCVVQIVTF